MFGNNSEMGTILMINNSRVINRVFTRSVITDLIQNELKSVVYFSELSRMLPALERLLQVNEEN